MTKSFFTFNENEAKSSFEPLKPGEYEFVISDTEIKQSNNGNDMIKLTLTVRTDVPQQGQNRKVFENLVFTEKALFKVHQLLAAVGTEQGRKFKDINDISSYLKAKPVRAKVKNEPYVSNDGEQKVADRVVVFLPTQHPLDPNAMAAGSDPFASDGSLPSISEDDLPF